MELKEKYKEKTFLFRVSDDGVCATEGCENKIPKHSKCFCEDCKTKRKEFFRKKHYEKMGWPDKK
jgi:hypothetical protein